MGVDLAIITGAGRGIGRSIALAVGETGAHVICISQTDRCVVTAESIKLAGGSAEGIVQDIADLERCERVIAEAVGKHGQQQLGLVLAAAIIGSPGGIRNGPPLAEWDHIYRTNVLGNLAVLRGCLPRMIEARFGRVVALAGGGAAYAYPEFSAYALSKTAMVRAIENAHAELEQVGDVLFVALSPGAVETDMLRQVRAAGGHIRTLTSASEAARFVTQWFGGDGYRLSGRFIHVRDAWSMHLSSAEVKLSPDHWKLRRIE